jgi:hypothetical protein
VIPSYTHVRKSHDNIMMLVRAFEANAENARGDCERDVWNEAVLRALDLADILESGYLALEAAAGLRLELKKVHQAKVLGMVVDEIGRKHR